MSLAHAVIGNTAMGGLAQGAWGIGNNYVPLWNKYMPRGAHEEQGIASSLYQWVSVQCLLLCSGQM